MTTVRGFAETTPEIPSAMTYGCNNDTKKGASLQQPLITVRYLAYTSPIIVCDITSHQILRISFSLGVLDKYL